MTTAVRDPEVQTLGEGTTALADLGVEPEELMAAIRLLREAKAKETAEREAAERRKATGYPKALYNSKFPFESIALADSQRRIAFHKGRIEVPDAATEAHIRQHCPGRIFEADMPEEKVCKRCPNFVTASSECWQIHMEWHTP